MNDPSRHPPAIAAERAAAIARLAADSGDGRPLAFQIVGRPFDEATTLRLDHAHERATAWVARRPALA